MKTYWSPSRAGFYCNLSAYPEQTLPGDLVQVTEKKWQDLLAASAAGATIVSDDRGRPKAVFPTFSPVARRDRAVRRIKAEARRRIEAIMPMHKQLNAMRSGEASHPDFAKVDAIRAASNLIEQDMFASADPETFPIATNPLWPEA